MRIALDYIGYTIFWLCFGFVVSIVWLIVALVAAPALIGYFEWVGR